MNTFKELIATMVIDNLDSNSTQSSLSARCGKVLAEKEAKTSSRVDSNEANITNIQSLIDSLTARLEALETWKSQVLNGTTTVLVETEATSTTSDAASSSSDNAINTEGLSEPTLGDVEVEETTEETEVESSSESQSESSSESLSESLSESESMSESLSDSESESQSESESTSESNTESEVKSESIQIEPQQKEELS